MFCAISGTTPEDPVVSIKSGLLFERRLIHKAIAETGSCPVTGDPLTETDLVEVKSNKAVRPRPLQSASIPGLLTLFQNEWDALALRDFSLEQQLNTVREELSYALYQSDAAFRVIARLIRERDEARTLLSQAQGQLSAYYSSMPTLSDASAHTAPPANALTAPMANGKRAMDGVEEESEEERAAKRAKQGISADIIEQLAECNARLSSQRKKRQIPASLASPEEIESFTQLGSHPLHRTGKQGIYAIDVHPSKDLIVTAGYDGTAVVLDRAKGQIMATLGGHTKRVTAVKFVSARDLVVTASADKTVRVWKPSAADMDEDTPSPAGTQCRHVLKDHTAEVKAVTVHPTGDYFVSASSDKTWCFYELFSGVCLKQVTDDSMQEGYTTAAFHPDGLILGTGTGESLVRIWDVKTQANVAKFEGHEGPISHISFSENGYFLATAAQDGVKLWDLRKLRNFRTFAPWESTVNTNCVEFDHSGSYLAMAGADIRIYQVGSVKQEWEMVKVIADVSGTGKVTALKFGPDAKYLAAGSLDRNLRIFGPASEKGRPGADEDGTQ